MDIENFRLESKIQGGSVFTTEADAASAMTLAMSTVRQTLPRHRDGERFIKGPIPLSWMKQADKCGYRGAAVAVLLWYAAGWQKSGEVRLTARIRQEFGIDGKTAKRVLEKMQSVGLVQAQFHRGKSTVVTLLQGLGEELSARNA